MTVPMVTFIASLHSERNSEAFLYLRVDGDCYRIKKRAGAHQMELLPFDNVEKMREEARTINKYQPHYQMAQHIREAPLTQPQLTAMIARLKLHGYFKQAG